MKKWIGGIILFIILGGYVAYTSYYRISKNFYEVDPGKFYRSAQLFPSEFRGVINEYGIRTVVSLRGTREDEVEVLKEKSVKFFSLNMDMDEYPTKENLRELLRIYRSEPGPILVHCRSGSDRTGEASALWVIDQMHKSNEEALSQLSFRYWHVPFLHPAKQDFIKKYKGYDWAMKEYDNCNSEFKLYSSCRK